jgi:pimeloyl-ACP methyl ester carboxylesterase
MDNIRKYGSQPFDIAVMHGGPGAPGQAAPLARELSKSYGVLEPLQTENSIEGQIQELKEVLENKSAVPVVLIGHSWGAWLGYIFAAQYPRLVNKLILIGSGSYEEEYVSAMNNSRMSRLTEQENIRVKELMALINDPYSENRKSSLSEFGKLMSKADSFAPISLEDEILDFQPDVFQNCMKEVRELRKSKMLLDMGAKIKCPVTAIHGQYDPHDYEGVKQPLSKVIDNFKFVLLKDCGHYPWNELYAKEQFYQVLHQEIKCSLQKDITI